MQPQRPASALPIPTITRFVVPATIMLSFVSFWRAAAIVLSDLGSSAYYVGGIAETKIGKSAPWFVLGIMLFSYAVRAVYIESCSMFTRGGVYRVVREAMGTPAAKFSVSALMFDYVLTGPNQRRQRRALSGQPARPARRPIRAAAPAALAASWWPLCLPWSSSAISGGPTPSASRFPARALCG